MTTPTQGEHAQTEALDDLYLKLHGMSKRLESSGRIDESDAPEAYPAILDAMNLVRRLQCESAQVAALTPTPECLTCNDHGAVGNILTAEPCPDCTPAQPAAPQGVAEVNWWEADGDKYDASISPMQPAQGVAYAELPKDVIRAVFIENGFTVKEGQTDLKQYVYDAAIELLRRARLRASNGQAPATKEAGEPARSNCMDCANTDSWGLPDKVFCRTCVSGSHWEPLNRDSVNPNKAAPQPTPTAQAASSAVLKAIREANMQLVRTGDDAFMLVPYKAVTAQAAESVPAYQWDTGYPPLPKPNIQRGGFQNLFTEGQMRAYVDADRAARKQGGA